MGISSAKLEFLIGSIPAFNTCRRWYAHLVLWAALRYRELPSLEDRVSHRKHVRFQCLSDGMSIWCSENYGDAENSLRSRSGVSLVTPEFSISVADGTGTEYSRCRKDTRSIHQRRSMFSLEARWVPISVGDYTSTEC